MTAKPPLPETFSFAPVSRIPVDQTEGSDYRQVLWHAVAVATDWATGPDGPFAHPAMTPYESTRGQLNEALLHLLELGIIDIDGERLAHLLKVGLPVGRERRDAA